MFSLGLGYLVLKLGWGIYGIGYTQIFVWILILISSWILISKKFTPISFEIDFDFFRKLLKSSIPFALMLVFTGLYLNLDTVLLSFFKGDQAVGLYNAANRLVLAGKMIPGIMIPVLFPIMSEISKKSKEEFDRFLGKSLTLMFCLGLPISVGTTFLADKTINLFFGTQFSGSALALQILIWGMFCMYLSIVMGNGLIAKGYQRFNTAITGIGLGISLLLNFFLIQRFGHLGTSVAILTTEFFVMMAAMFYGRKLLGFDLKRLFVPFLKVIFATLVTSIVLYLTKELNLFFCAGAGIVSYFVVLFSLKGLYGYNFYKLRDLILARTA
jgi:O-antigen/teichoic acid export membrane protein